MQSSSSTMPTSVRLGGTAAALAGLCYGAAGYLDRPGISGYTGILVSVLIVAIPALFLGGLMGLYVRLLLVAQTSLASGAGLVLGCFGSVLGMVGTLGLARTPYSQITEWWWVPLLVGLALMGLALSPMPSVGFPCSPIRPSLVLWCPCVRSMSQVRPRFASVPWCGGRYL
jgi:hypothetical protein